MGRGEGGHREREDGREAEGSAERLKAGVGTQPHDGWGQAEA